MNKTIPTPKLHLFICTNSPDKEGRCGHKGSENLKKEVKMACSQFGKEVRINSSGCLGQCEKGIAAVLYPQGKWFFNHTAEDKDFFTNLITEEIKKIK